MAANQTIQLTITARRSITVLPRCLQILSRRGFTLTDLKTELLNDNRIIMHCSANGPERWQQPLSRLLERLVDVEHVRSDMRKSRAHE